MPWQIVSNNAFHGMGSMGNGGAMRAGPLGAYFADDFHAVVENSRTSAFVTHAHPEGQAGAIAVAIAAAQAWRLRSAGMTSSPQKILEAALEYTPNGKTQQGIKIALSVPFTEDVASAVEVLGNGSRIIAHDTVPFALWCAARHLTDFQSAFWTAASALGDIDTNCAIVGSIVALTVGHEGIPEQWINSREPLV
jgi:ADP-ribosylglycohydrolase